VATKLAGIVSITFVAAAKIGLVTGISHWDRYLGMMTAMTQVPVPMTSALDSSRRTVAATAVDEVFVLIGKVGAGGGEGVAASQQASLLLEFHDLHRRFLICLFFHILLLFNHYLELCSSPLTFGKA